MMQRKPGLPSLDGLRYFDAAARNLSFTRAAQDLFLTQSAVSQKIQSLEQQLGYLVFHRTPAGLRLTPQGEQLLSECARPLPSSKLRCTKPVKKPLRAP